VAVFDAELRPRWEWLARGRAPALATPPMLMAFDCLYRDRDLRSEPLWYRRAALEKAIDGARAILPMRHLPPHGLDAWAEVEQYGYEGLIGKDERAPYVGERTLRWLKLKRADARDRRQFRRS
jgi:ATP-dependent DNA ligase